MELKDKLVTRRKKGKNEVTDRQMIILANKVNRLCREVDELWQEYLESQAAKQDKFSPDDC
jgi:hypothetical protein